MFVQTRIQSVKIKTNLTKVYLIYSGYYKFVKSLLDVVFNKLNFKELLGNMFFKV